MDLTYHNILLVGSILLFISLFAGKTSSRFGVPVIILFILVGMLAGSEGIGGILFSNPKTTQFIGVIALCCILFSGGLDTDWGHVRPVLWQGVLLSTAGVLITAFSVALFVWLITDFTFIEALLLGSIVSSTDSASVFSILRSKNLALKGNIRSILELESGSNDPMAYVMTLICTGLVMHQNSSAAEIITLFSKDLILGGALGLIIGMAGTIVINRIRFDYEGLYIALVIAIMFFSFSLTDFLKGNGFLAVYICAIYIGNHDVIHKKKILKSFDSFAWLMQIILFLTLGLLVLPSQLMEVMGIGMLVAGFLILVARPLSIFLSLIPFRITSRVKLFLSWGGLRGAVPIVFATYPLLAGAEKAGTIFNIVFFVSMTSVVIQGTSLAKVARWLHLTLPVNLKQRNKSDIEFTESPKSLLTEVIVKEGCPAAGKKIVQLGWPTTIVISTIERDGKYFIPTGATKLEKGDRLFLLAENRDSLNYVFDCVNIKQ